MRLAMCKKRRRLLPFIPTEDPERRLEQMGSLATALTALRMEFSNELTYMPGMAPRSANKAKLERGGMQVVKYCFYELLYLEFQALWMLSFLAILLSYKFSYTSYFFRFSPKKIQKP